MLRVAIIGTGFWANYQIPAWMELEDVQVVAVYNRTKAKAEATALRYGINEVYEDVQSLLDQDDIDVVDIITDVDTHADFTLMAANKGISVICQKPMAPSLSTATKMVKQCSDLNVPFFVHENFRWQAPIRKVKQLLNDLVIGDIFKARVTFCSGFPVFENQPFLAELEQFILTDIGSHVLDICRFLFGEVDTLQCHTATVNPNIKGEDVANVFMKMQNGMTCYAEMSYASILAQESFPQTLILIEGELGSIQLTYNCEVIVTTRKQSTSILAKPIHYPWADPAYALVHASIVDCNRNILHALQGKIQAETTGRDNLETVRLVHACYISVKNKRIITLAEFS